MDLNPNKKLVDAFELMAQQNKKDKYRARAYKNAAAAIRNHKGAITSGKQAKDEIKGVGKSIADKIDEILKTGTLEVLESRTVEEKQRDESTKAFELVFGIGPVLASKLYDSGYRTLQDLANYYPQMTDAQKLGYYYFNDLQLKIPRNEIDLINKFLHSIFDPRQIKFEITGSYRRGLLESGDIDILVQNINQKGEAINLFDIINSIKATGFIVGDLALGETKYMGIVKASEHNSVRRLDIRLVDPVAWPFAVLYFTGSKTFNVDLRNRAISQGLSLNEYALTDVNGKSHPTATEKDIFDILRVQYLEPWERNGDRPLTSTDIVKPTFHIGQSLAQKERIPNGKWYRPVESLFVYVADDFVPGPNIAAFDLDGTLVRPAQGDFAKATNDYFIMPNRLKVLKDLISKNYTIVIFTNQKSKSDSKRQFNYDKVAYAIDLLNIPLILFMATGEDEYRKPGTGMFLQLKTMIANINMVNSFYCGDAYDKTKHFSDSDLMFANNAGLKFFTPEQLFGV